MTERKFFLVGQDGVIRSRVDPHSNGPLARRFHHAPKYIKWQGKPMVRLGEGTGSKGLYSLRGKIYRYNYRLLRQLGRVNYEGHAMFFLEDNPQAINFDKDEWSSDLDGAAHMLEELRESDMPERLARPRKVDLMTVLVGFMGGALLVLSILAATGRLK